MKKMKSFLSGIGFYKNSPNKPTESTSTSSPTEPSSDDIVLQSLTLPDQHQIDNQDPEVEITSVEVQAIQTESKKVDKENSDNMKNANRRRGSVQSDYNTRKRRTGSLNEIIDQLKSKKERLSGESSEEVVAPNRRSSRGQSFAEGTEKECVIKTEPAPTESEPESDKDSEVSGSPVPDEEVAHTSTPAAADCDEDDEACNSDDVSVYTSCDEQSTSFKCSETFAEEYEKKIQKMGKIYDVVSRKLERMKQDTTKKVKNLYTRSGNLYDNAQADFWMMKTRGMVDVQFAEAKLEKDYQSVMKYLTDIKESLENGTGIAVIPTGKQVAKKDSGRSKEKEVRVARYCRECRACLITEDCAKCKFCLDKKRFGGKNTLRQKCILRQCLNLGKFIKTE